LFIALIGKLFWNNGDRYEGECKDGNPHGQGKKSALLNYLLILTYCSFALIGEFFWNFGGRYEGEYKDGK